MPIRAVRIYTLLLACLLALLLYPTPASAGDHLNFTILFTGSENSALVPHSSILDYHPVRPNPSRGGFSRLSTMIHLIRADREAAGEETLLFSAGGFISGSPFGWLSTEGPSPALHLMQTIGYSAVAISMCDYSYGADHLAGILTEAGYPGAHSQTVLLASNASFPADHPLAGTGLLKESSLFFLENGLAVGVISLVGCCGAGHPPCGQEVFFQEPAAAATRLAAELRLRGAEVVVALTDSGPGDDLALAGSATGINLIIGKGDHLISDGPVRENGVIIARAADNLSHLGQLDLVYDRSDGTLSISSRGSETSHLLPVDYSYACDPDIEPVIEEARADLDGYIARMSGERYLSITDPVALSSFVISGSAQGQQTPLGSFVTDAMRFMVGEEMGINVDFALKSSGSLNGCVYPGTMPHSIGKVSFYDLAAPVSRGMGPDGRAGDSLFLVYLSGKEIRQLVEASLLLAHRYDDRFILQCSGMRYSYNPGNVIFATFPFLDCSLPTGRALVSLERYTGAGLQDEADFDFLPLARNDNNFYSLAADSSLLALLPLLNDLSSAAPVTFKDQAGREVDLAAVSDLAVKDSGGDYKLWMAVADYAAAQPPAEGGYPRLAAEYAAESSRIMVLEGLTYDMVALAALPSVLLIFIFLALVFQKNRLT